MPDLETAPVEVLRGAVSARIVEAFAERALRLDGLRSAELPVSVPY